MLQHEQLLFDLNIKCRDKILTVPVYKTDCDISLA